MHKYLQRTQWSSTMPESEECRWCSDQLLLSVGTGSTGIGQDRICFSFHSHATSNKYYKQQLGLFSKCVNCTCILPENMTVPMESAQTWPVKSVSMHVLIAVTFGFWQITDVCATQLASPSTE